MINGWFGTFYNMVQQALGKPGSVTLEAFFGQLWTFGWIAMVYIFTAVLTAFFTSHYVFRWRTAMNEFYVEHWQRLRHIEGASQRVQEDTQRFADTVEGLGVEPGPGADDPDRLPADPVGPVVLREGAAGGRPRAAGAGVRRRGLGGARHRRPGGWPASGCPGSSSATSGSRRPTARSWCWARTTPRAPQPPTLRELFADVRANYFRLYANFLYFNVVRYGYLQAERAGALHRAGADHRRRRADARRA